MRYLVGSIGVILVAVVLWETFETIVLPRRVTRLLRVMLERGARRQPQSVSAARDLPE